MNSDINGNLIHGKMMHEIRRRVRVVSPALLKDQERAYILEILLNKRPGVIAVRTVPAIASVAVDFDPGKLKKADLLTHLDAVLANLGHKKPTAIIKSTKYSESGTPLPEKEYNLTIEGMTCSTCALLIEMVLKRDERISSASVNYATETAAVTGRIESESLCALINSLGYRAYSFDTLAQRQLLIVREKEHLKEARFRAVLAAALSLPVMAVSMAAPASRFWHWLQHLLAMPVVLWAGWPFFAKAAKLARQRTTNMDTLIALGVGSSYGYSVVSLFRRQRGLYFDSASGILTFVLIGRYLEEKAKAKGKAHAAIRKLVDLQPQQATVLLEGREMTVNLDQVGVGDLLLARPGEKIPTDGVVLEGVTTVDESMLTGESMPVVKEPGHNVTGGCINGNGNLKIKVSAIGKDTVLANIIHMVDQAQSSKLPIQKTVDRISAVFVPSVMAGATLTFAG